MVADHINYLTFEDPGAVNTVRRALKLAEAGDLYGAAETAGVDVAHAAVVSEGLRRGMRFSIGAELDNDPRSRPDAQNIVDAMRPDGMIRAVHFLTIEHPEKGPDWQWPFDNPEFRDLHEVVGVQRTWELYMAKLIDDLEKLPGHIVGHFYAPAELGGWPDRKQLEQHEDRLLEVCRARGIAVEINTRFLYRDNPEDRKQKYRDALLRLMRKARSKGVGIAVGSDAHSPKDQAASFDIVLKLLDEAKINELVFPVNGRLAIVALRATKEHLQKVKAQEPVQAPGSSITGFGRAELGLPEELERVGALSKTGHDAGPRKRASGPARVTKKPLKESAAREKAHKTKPQAPAASRKKIAAGKSPARKAKAKRAATAARLPQRLKKAQAARPSAGKRQKTTKAAKSSKKAPARKKPARSSVKRPAAKKAPGRKAPVKKTAPKRPGHKKTPLKKRKSTRTRR